MLYTFSHTDYSETQLVGYLNHLSKNDAVLLWQDGVILAIKYPKLFQSSYLLDIDVAARNLSDLLPKQIHIISLPELVKLTENFYPQVSL